MEGEQLVSYLRCKLPSIKELLAREDPFLQPLGFVCQTDSSNRRETEGESTKEAEEEGINLRREEGRRNDDGGAEVNETRREERTTNIGSHMPLPLPICRTQTKSFTSLRIKRNILKMKRRTFFLTLMLLPEHQNSPQSPNHVTQTTTTTPLSSEEVTSIPKMNSQYPSTSSLLTTSANERWEPVYTSKFDQKLKIDLNEAPLFIANCNFVDPVNPPFHSYSLPQ